MSTTPSDFSVEKLHPLTKKLLNNRGIIEEKDIEAFLFPSYEHHIGDPFAIHGMKPAVDRILEALKNNEKIAIYSDYDCDGIPGGVLLRTFFDDIGYPVEIYIPHRHNEGYGVHTHALDTLKERGVTLVITVDSGITNIEEVAYAKSIGVDMIVTDHHLPITAVAEQTRKSRGKDAEDTEKISGNKKNKTRKQEDTKEKLVQVVPDAVAVINSKQDVCTYHDDMLCGCAVAWKLSCAILETLRGTKIAQDSFHAEQTRNKRGKDAEKNKNAEIYNKVLEKVAALPEGYEKWYLDLVGISTIADMVPLVKENRALAHFGLKVLRKTKRPGLLHIFNEQRMRLDFLTEDDIAFTIAPRINAASRMGDPIQAHLMLYEKDRESAEGYAYELEELNTQRKSEVKDIVSTISFDHAVYSNEVIVVGDMSWGPGILGLIAQKIIDETGKPVFVWGIGEGETTDNRQQAKDSKKILKGSCRSLGEVSVVDLMAHVGKTTAGGVFEGYGGHEGAGGFSLLLENVDRLSDALNNALSHVERKEIGGKEIQVDTVMSIDEVHDMTYEAIAALAPFGEGNRKPVFEIQDPRVLATKWFGKKGEHFEVVYATSRGGKVKAIQFFAPKDIEEKVNKKHSILVHLERSYFGGRVELRLRIVEVR
jgi:single-stranded-DNA-specific exonuclease